jgi:hypothetical protein
MTPFKFMICRLLGGVHCGGSVLFRKNVARIAFCPPRDPYDLWSLTSIRSALCVSGLDKPLKMSVCIRSPCHWWREAFSVVWILYRWRIIEWCYLSEVACPLIFDAIPLVNHQAYRSRMKPPYSGTAKDQVYFFRCASVTFYTDNCIFSFTHKQKGFLLNLKEFKIYIKTLKTLQHVSIIWSSSWSLHCAWIRLYIKNQ